MNKKAATLVVAFLLSAGAFKMANNGIDVNLILRYGCLTMLDRRCFAMGRRIKIESDSIKKKEAFLQFTMSPSF
jgi:hypothetical protein